jgi:hypothetical protein
MEGDNAVSRAMLFSFMTTTGVPRSALSSITSNIVVAIYEAKKGRELASDLFIAQTGYGILKNASDNDTETISVISRRTISAPD